MKKTYRLENLDCGNCAAKMERAIKKIDGVQEASVNFMTQRLHLEADDENYNEILDTVQATCAKIEPDCKILIRR